MAGKWEMEGKDFAMLPFASWHIRDFALLANTLIIILAKGGGQSMYKNISSQKSPPYKSAPIPLIECLLLPYMLHSNLNQHHIYQWYNNAVRLKFHHQQCLSYPSMKNHFFLLLALV